MLRLQACVTPCWFSVGLAMHPGALSVHTRKATFPAPEQCITMATPWPGEVRPDLVQTSAPVLWESLLTHLELHRRLVRGQGPPSSAQHLWGSFSRPLLRLFPCDLHREAHYALISSRQCLAVLVLICFTTSPFSSPGLTYLTKRLAYWLS